MKIIHCFRSPVGGIFRHVKDLLAEQTDQGHEVGFICDSSTGGAYEDQLIEQIKPRLALGLYRFPMARSISPKDAVILLSVIGILKRLKPDVVHTHTAKGGVYGRLGAWLASGETNPIKTFYCPHGGAMHYDRKSLKGKVFFSVERFLERYTTGLIFISNYEKTAYHEKVGTPRCPETVVHNGISDAEFEPVKIHKDAADFLYIGMMRDLKGPDLFIEALDIARQKSGLDLTAVFVGDGDDKPKYIDQISSRGLSGKVSVHDAMPTREAFAMAHTVVVPSRAESLPYLVLEAVAAQKPIVATDVGGIHEIFGEARSRLVVPDDAKQLAVAMLEQYQNKALHAEAKQLAEIVKGRFSVKAMAAGMQVVYQG